MTDYVLESPCCGMQFADGDWALDCPKKDSTALIRTCYVRRQLRVREELPGLYKFADWLPISRMLEGSGAPVTYKSKGLAKELGLTNLYITFNGYWPEKGALMLTGTFKECEAYSVCARPNRNSDKVMVVASAGNTARAFARVCSKNKIPLLLCVPQDCMNSVWSSEELDPCVKLVGTVPGSDYFDAIRISNIICEMDEFYPEGGAKNVARRDGMGTTVLSAVTTIGRIPDYYFQAVGSGTGAIAAWEANKRFIEDGRYGNHLMKLMVSQNIPFVPMYEAWKANSRELFPCDAAVARKQAEEICAKVLSNRKPPFSMPGGLFDALTETKGEVFVATNEEALQAADMFLRLEGADIEPAAGVATASLIQAVRDGKVAKDAVIMLNITGGGIQRFKRENRLIYKSPDFIFPMEASEGYVKKMVTELYNK
ncbi:cysteate synthase [Odoribacter lunatus]|uniref:cysteate synthase n=1 Tax=Odoribacter lunatus TaxID=2941335 RepID=UPI00203D844B|nr:cysteate synthase [Odoribacter lunatus]